MPKETLYLNGEGSDTSSIKLSPEQGQKLRELIERRCKCRFATYTDSLDFKVQNVLNYLSGSKRVSYQVLRRLLSGIEYKVECQISFSISPGNTVKGVPSQSLEQMSFLEGPEGSQEDTSNGMDFDSIMGESP